MRELSVLEEAVAKPLRRFEEINGAHREPRPLPGDLLRRSVALRIRLVFSVARKLLRDVPQILHQEATVGVGDTVSIPDGANSRLTDALLAPLESASEILIATDADEPGERAAQALARRLGPGKWIPQVRGSTR